MNPSSNSAAVSISVAKPRITLRSRIAIVSASWHTDIVQQARDACVAELARQGWPSDQIDLLAVPGALEIPLHAQKLAKTKRYDAIIACALVVDGGIYRHEFVTAAVIDGLMRVQLDTEVPVFSVVLTPKDFQESDDHVQFFTAHFVKKGTEAARACLQTVAGLQAVEMLHTA